MQFKKSVALGYYDKLLIINYLWLLGMATIIKWTGFENSSIWLVAWIAIFLFWFFVGLAVLLLVGFANSVLYPNKFLDKPLKHDKRPTEGEGEDANAQLTCSLERLRNRNRKKPK
jgi:hypothetical protein